MPVNENFENKAEKSRDFDTNVVVNHLLWSNTLGT